MSERREYGRRVSPRARIWTVVAVVAVAAAGVTVGGTLLTRTGTGGSKQSTTPPSGVPPLVLDLAVRTDPEAVALRQASAIYDSVAESTSAAAARKRAQARAIFSRYRSLEAQEGGALSSWPEGAVTVGRLARENPRSALAQLEVGFVDLWQGRGAAAEQAWRKAKQLEPDSEYAVRAADLLHPKDVPGLPFFVPTTPFPPALDRLSPPKQLAYLAARARTGGAPEKLLYGVALQRIFRPVSALEQFREAVRTAPDDPEARVAVAVGLFDKDHPQVAFGRLGPLTRVFPKAVTVRFHLGLLLVWIGQLQAARGQLTRVVSAGPSPLAAPASKLLAQLAPAKKS